MLRTADCEFDNRGAESGVLLGPHSAWAWRFALIPLVGDAIIHPLCTTPEIGVSCRLIQPRRVIETLLEVRRWETPAAAEIFKHFVGRLRLARRVAIAAGDFF